MDKLRASIIAVFPRTNAADILPETLLGDIPDWDSMNSVNLLLELEEAFSVSLIDSTLQETDKVAGIIALLASKGAIV